MDQIHFCQILMWADWRDLCITNKQTTLLLEATKQVKSCLLNKIINSFIKWVDYLTSSLHALFVESTILLELGHFCWKHSRNENQGIALKPPYVLNLKPWKFISNFIFFSISWVKEKRNLTWKLLEVDLWSKQQTCTQFSCQLDVAWKSNILFCI